MEDVLLEFLLGVIIGAIINLIIIHLVLGRGNR